MEPEGTAARHWAMPLCRNAGFRTRRAAFLPKLVFSGQPRTVTLRQLPRGQRTRRIFIVVRRGRSRHPAVLACRDALRRAVILRSNQAAPNDMW
ncbi:hypothetical protein [Streptomyces regalis]|nr:hypothetical protein [Streptomyces regalis]